ncbi:MAG: HTH domain-containing protein [Lachnospiraceae bacterium]
MAEKILELLKDGKAVTVEELADKLRVSREEINACIQFLSQLGYIRAFVPGHSCEGGCSSCSGCEKPFAYPVMWECT